MAPLPIPFLFFLALPLEEQETSYLALSAKISNFSFKVIGITGQYYTTQHEYLFANFYQKKFL